MLYSDWLSYYWAICYSPLVAKSAHHICNVLSAKKAKSARSSFNKHKMFCFDNNAPFTLMASESIAHEAESAMPIQRGFNIIMQLYWMRMDSYLILQGGLYSLHF